MGPGAVGRYGFDLGRRPIPDGRPWLLWLRDSPNRPENQRRDRTLESQTAAHGHHPGNGCQTSEMLRSNRKPKVSRLATASQRGTTNSLNDAVWPLTSARGPTKGPAHAHQPTDREHRPSAYSGLGRSCTPCLGRPRERLSH